MEKYKGGRAKAGKKKAGSRIQGAEGPSEIIPVDLVNPVCFCFLGI
jgi:hypothetical protein